MGQKIVREQFPFLFDAEPGMPQPRQIGRTYRPLFFGKTEAKLNNVWPLMPNDMRRAGWYDNYTRIARTSLDNRVPVSLMATRAQVNARGQCYPAGFQFTILVERGDFEKFYGPLDQGPEESYGADFQTFSGYDTVKFG